MPSSGKVFIVPDEKSLDEIELAVENFKEVERDEDLALDLIKDIAHLRRVELELDGVYSYDYLVSRYYRGNFLVSPATQECPFTFLKDGEKMWLIVYCSKGIADKVANKLSEIIYGAVGEIKLAKIRSREIDDYLKENYETRVIFIEDMDIPSINKSTIYGKEFIQTSLFNQLRNSGSPRYVITKSKARGYTVGIVNDGAIVIFNQVDQREFQSFLEAEILPIIHVMKQTRLEATA